MFRPVPGAMVGSRYRLQSVIGAGGMGEIWRAHDTELEGPYAVKFILGHLATDEGVRARLLREAKAAAGLRSAHAVHVLGVGEHEGAMYLAMELLEGEPLSARLARRQLLSPSETITLLSQVTHALEKAHAAGIVHRDLKPDNIWLCADHALFAKVLDFGVAKQLSFASKHTATGALVGTPHYMSPEQAMAEREVDHRSDLWALAIIAVECLTGKRPFEANGIAPLLLKLVSQAPPPLAQLGAHLPVTLEAWWQHALQREPERRFQSASELVEGLRRGFDASAGATSLPVTQLAPLPSVSSAPAQTVHEPARSVSGSPVSMQSMSPFSRTHAAQPTGWRWRRWLVVGGAVTALVAGTGLALRGQGELAVRIDDAGASAAGTTQLNTTQLNTTQPPAPSITVMGATLQATVAEEQRSSATRPPVSPLPPPDANPWTRSATAAGETSVRSPKVAKALVSEPASLSRADTTARAVAPVPKRTAAKSGTSKPPAAAAKPVAPAAGKAAPAVPVVATPADSTPYDEPSAAPAAKAPAEKAPVEKARDLGF